MHIPTFIFIFILFRTIILLLLLYPTHVIKLLGYNLGCYKTSQLCGEKNELGKQVNALKNEKEESLNELKQIKTTMWMMNSGTTTLD